MINKIVILICSGTTFTLFFTRYHVTPNFSFCYFNYLEFNYLFDVFELMRWLILLEIDE